jgi:hypothetical protein
MQTVQKVHEEVIFVNRNSHVSPIAIYRLRSGNGTTDWTDSR